MGRHNAWLCGLPVGWPQASRFTSLSLSDLVCESGPKRMSNTCFIGLLWEHQMGWSALSTWNGAWCGTIMWGLINPCYYLFLHSILVSLAPASLPPSTIRSGNRHNVGTFLGTAYLILRIRCTKWERALEISRLFCRGKEGGHKFTQWLVVTSFSAHSHPGSLIQSPD